MAANDFNYKIATNPGARFRQLGMGRGTWRDADVFVSRRAARWARRGTGSLMMRFGDWVARAGSALVGGR